MATNYCKNCGANLSPESKFCENCGQSADAAHTVTQESYKTPHQAPATPLTPSSRLGAAFWLGLVGAIFGLLIGAALLAISTLSFVETSGEGWAIMIGVIIFSILGIVGPLRIIDKGDTVNAGLMVIAGVGMLICIRQIGAYFQHCCFSLVRRCSI